MAAMLACPSCFFASTRWAPTIRTWPLPSGRTTTGCKRPTVLIDFGKLVDHLRPQPPHATGRHHDGVERQILKYVALCCS